MKKQELSLQVINEHAAGIDIGSRFHMVAIDQLKEKVRQFGVYTKDHEQLIDYLLPCRVCPPPFTGDVSEGFVNWVVALAVQLRSNRHLKTTSLPTSVGKPVGRQFHTTHTRQSNETSATK